MKKSILLLFVFIFAIALCGCGGDDSSSDEKSAEKQEVKHHYTENQTEMSNYINEGKVLLSDGWIYSIGWGADTGKQLFMKMRDDGSDDIVIRYYEEPRYINIKGEYIYAALLNEKNQSNIFRYRLGGDKEKKLLKNATHLQIIGDELYYCKTKKNDVSTTTKYCKSDLKGKHETVILDKEIYYPYIIDNQLYYQDDKDNETIHVYDLDTKKDERITNKITYGYVLNDEYLYCIQNNKSVTKGDYNGKLMKIDLKTKDAKVLYDGASTDGFSIKDDNIYFLNTNDQNRIYKIDKNGEKINIVTQDNYCYAPYIYGNKMIYLDAAKKYKYIDNIYMCDLDGSNKESLLKKY